MQVVLTALADLPVTVIAATADRSDLTERAGQRVRGRLPAGGGGRRPLGRGASAMAAAWRREPALVAGVPVVGIAGNLDQRLNMEAIERAGAGILLRTERHKSGQVAKAVPQAISRSDYGQAAQRLAEA